MVSLPVFDRSGNEVGSYEIDPAALAPKLNKQLMHDVVVMYQANRRQGSATTRSRGEVRGSTRKMYRQKGTGNARAGSRRSGVRRGGGHIFAIRPRDYSYRLPRRAVQAATRMAIRSKLESGAVVVVDGLSFDQPCTKEMAAVLQALKLAGQSTLVATPAYDVNLYKSARNIQRVSVCPVSDLNALAVLEPQRMLVTTEALDAIQSRAQAKKQGTSQDVGIPEAGE